MQNQSIRLFLYSSIAILILTLVWGVKVVPKQAELADKALRESLEQELILLSSAVKTGSDALKFRLLDILKTEGNERPTRALQDSPFIAAALLEWDQTQWKVLWNTAKTKTDFTDVKPFLKNWPLAKIVADEVFFAKVGDHQGQPYYALVVPVRKTNNVPMLGIGLFPAASFGLSFASDRARDIRVFDPQGFALALSHPAYLGASLKNEPVVSALLEGDEVSVRKDWRADRGTEMTGVAMRLPESNLSIGIETQKTAFSVLPFWLYLLMSAAGALALNWWLFSKAINPLLKQLGQVEDLNESLKRQISERNAGVIPANATKTAVMVETELPDSNFIEPTREPESSDAAPVTKTLTLAKLVQSALRSLDMRLRESAITVVQKGLEAIPLQGDVLQLQTAIEEILKNAIEAMQNTRLRDLTISAESANGRIHLKIRDSGEGINPENLGKVFDPFYSTKDSEGVSRGLGLNVVRRVFEEIRGKVNLVSEPGIGTTVSVEWPTELTTESNAVPETGIPTATVTESASNLTMKDMIFLEDSDEDEDMDEFSAKPMSSQSANPNVTIRKPVVRNFD